MVFVFVTYFGYAIRYFVSKDTTGKDREKKVKDQKKIYLYIFLLTLIEVVASQLSNVGFSYVGSGVSFKKERKSIFFLMFYYLYQILFSSVILFNAIVAIVVLRQKITKYQWLALFAITSGLIIAAGNKRN